jgi:prepilin-type N-terminal cleavage/methylation domain-containing protein
MNTRQRTTRAFTLIELLVVIAIIMILAGILVPGINKAIQMGYAAKTRSAIRELSGGAHAYEIEYGYFPGQKRDSSLPKGSLALGECLWGPPSATTALNKFLPFKDEKVMGEPSSDDDCRIPSDRFPDAMPLLYYPSTMCSTGSSLDESFFDENGSLDDIPSLSSWSGLTTNEALGKLYHYDTFLIIGAGIDRIFGPDTNGNCDDITNWR